MVAVAKPGIHRLLNGRRVACAGVLLVRNGGSAVVAGAERGAEDAEPAPGVEGGCSARGPDQLPSRGEPTAWPAAMVKKESPTPNDGLAG